MASRNRAAPVITVIIVMAALAFIAPALAKMHADPAEWVTKVTKVINITQTQKPKIDMKHSIWVNPRSGLFYCRQSKFYGRMRPGFYMSQGNALLKGYRPAEGHMCP